MWLFDFDFTKKQNKAETGNTPSIENTTTKTVNNDKIIFEDDSELTALFDFDETPTNNQPQAVAEEKPIEQVPVQIPTQSVSQEQVQQPVQEVIQQPVEQFIQQPPVQPQVQNVVPQVVQKEESYETDNLDDFFKEDTSVETESTLRDDMFYSDTNTLSPTEENSNFVEGFDSLNNEISTPNDVQETVSKETIIQQSAQDTFQQIQPEPDHIQAAPTPKQVEEIQLESVAETNTNDNVSDSLIGENGEYNYEALSQFSGAEEKEEKSFDFNTTNPEIEKMTNSVGFNSELLLESEQKKYGNTKNDYQLIQNFNDIRIEKKIFDEIMVDAINSDATDIHFETFWTNIVIKFRLMGGLTVQRTMKPDTYFKLLNYIKDIFKMKVDENREHQDGSYGYVFMLWNEQKVKRLRWVVLPTHKKYEEMWYLEASGKVVEALVIRLLAQNTKPFSELGLQEYSETILSAIDTEWIFLISWPTGSGKTTTLASIATYIANKDPSRKFYSIEDPVEIELQNIVQLELTSKFTILDAIKWLLRWDPDIIMVGEMREATNMNFAVDNANTWHIVFWTIHTKNAIGIKDRIKTQGANLELFMEAANLFLAQRLIPIAWKNISIKELKKQMYLNKNTAYLSNAYYRDFIYAWDKSVLREFVLKNQLLRRNILGEKFYRGLNHPELEKFKMLLKIFLDGWKLKMSGEVKQFQPWDYTIYKLIVDIVESNIYINDIYTKEDELYIRKELGIGDNVLEIPKSKMRYPIVEILNFKDVNIKLLMDEKNSDAEVLNREINFLTMFQDAFIKSMIWGKPWLLKMEERKTLSLNIVDYIKEGKQIYGFNPFVEETFERFDKELKRK